MKVICELTEQSGRSPSPVRVISSAANNSYVNLEVDGKYYAVKGSELISAVQRATLDCFGK